MHVNGKVGKYNPDKKYSKKISQGFRRTQCVQGAIKSTDVWLANQRRTLKDGTGPHLANQKLTY